MAKVVTDNNHYKAIADKIRERMKDAGFYGTMFPSEMAGLVDDACSAAHDKGYGAGRNAGAAECEAKHFVYSFVGNGGGSFSIKVPFEPDAVHIFSLDPTVINIELALAEFSYDRRAFGMLGGFAYWGNGTGGLKNIALTTQSVLNRYSRAEDGTITVQNIGGSESSPVVYSEGFVYTFTAIKYTGQTDKERITAFVNRLTGSGSVTLNKAKVNSAFADDEWAALIAAKPDWTFAFI